MKKNLISLVSNQPTLCLAFCCLLFFVVRDSWFVIRPVVGPSTLLRTGLSNPYTNLESRFYIELVKPDDFPIMFGLSSTQELKRAALLYNLEKLRNGDKLILDDNGTISLSRISGTKSLALGIPIGINSAGIDDLAALPGIGTKLAGRIIKYRNLNGRFKTIDELRSVDGIGEKKIESIKPFINLD